MPTIATTFDDNIARWKQEMDFPWAKLKYKLVQANLAKHLEHVPHHVLDAGGGNGLDSIPFAAQGHMVDIVHYSQAMLADAHDQAAHINAQKRIATHLADVRDVSNLFPEANFDVILCHNVLQYIDDVPALFEKFEKVLRPGGVISVVSINRYSTPFLAAFPGGDLTEALLQLDERISRTQIFDTTITSYSADEIGEMMQRVGIIVEKDYGIRCICDYWGDNERKATPTIFEQLERLEFALTELHPYKLLARYFQIVARKPKRA